MTRKRFIKLLMSNRIISRNMAIKVAFYLKEYNISYKEYTNLMTNMIKIK